MHRRRVRKRIVMIFPHAKTLWSWCPANYSEIWRKTERDGPILISVGPKYW